MGRKTSNEGAALDARGPRRPTIIDVARVCSVSPATVSRVLNHNPTVDPELRDRVKAAIKSLGFRPNLLAQSMRKQQTRVIACIVSNIANPMWASAVAAAEEVLRAAGYMLVVANSGDSIETELELLEFFGGQQVDGLMISTSTEEDPRLLDSLRGVGKPVVLLERQIGAEFDSVLSDHGAGVFRVAEKLLAQGHRDIAMLTGQMIGRPARVRIQNLQRAFAKQGLKPDPDLIRSGDNTALEFGYREAADLLRRQPRPTAIIAGAYEMIGVMRAVREMAVRVPDELTLVAVGDPETLQLVQPALTAVRWDERGLGRAAAEILLDRMEGRDADRAVRCIMIPSELVMRESFVEAAQTQAKPLLAKAGAPV